jgi:hypothetical protein
VRARRDLTSAIGIRNPGLVAESCIISSERKKISSGQVSLWESRCEDCVCFGMALKCNTQRAHTLEASAATVWAQFDSDYSDGDEASPLFSKVRTSFLCYDMDSH